jgi:diguanylate cyclase (GGDEF)-like protein/PAS domain S-box-containing protein
VDDRSESSAAGAVDGGWAVEMLASAADLVIALAPDTTITWCNAASQRLLGRDPADVVGRSFAELVHPEDLVRAGEVIELASAGVFDAYPMTAAVYRVLHADGSEVALEVNASVGVDGSLLVIAREGGDLVIVDRLIEQMAVGAPTLELAELTLQLGTWRHPHEGYAIFFHEGEQLRCASTGNVSSVLLDASTYDGVAPWSFDGDDHEERVIDPLPSAARHEGFVACLAAPVPDPANDADAAIVIWTAAIGPTTAGHRYAMSNMRRAFQLVLQQRAQVRRLERAAQEDALTGLVSRARLLELLEARTDDVAVLYVDLDGFKAVNDARGHLAGDAALVFAASQLRRVAPPGALVGRLGGDEFAIVCPPGTEVAEAEALAGGVVAALAAATGPGSGASVGVAVGAAGRSPSEVLHAADVALLAAKAAGRGCWRTAPAG